MFSLKTISIGTVSFFVCLLLIYGFYTRNFSMAVQLDRYVQRYVDLELFSGTVLVAKDGEIVFSKAYGMANYELDVPNKIDTKFRIASVTKQFTAMAIMQLQKMGLLSVQDLLSKYVPDFPRGNEITIHHLLTNTSGISHVTSASEEWLKERIKPHTLEQRIALIKSKPLVSQPGEEFNYSDHNYVLLTYIIEKISGKTYETFLKEHIFDLLNMKNTGYADYKCIIKNMAAGYASDDGTLVNADYLDMSWEVGAGALYSTVNDLYVWDRALYTTKLASQESLDKIFAPFKGGYGYGWHIEAGPYGKMIFHAGGNPGARTMIGRFVDRNTCIIVLSNFEYAPVEKILSNLAHILFTGKPEYTPKKHVVITMNPALYDQYVGTYQLKSENLTFAVTREHEKLFIEVIEQKDKREVFPEAENEFFVKDVDLGSQFSFVKNTDGKVTILILHQDGRDFSAEKI